MTVYPRLDTLRRALEAAAQPQRRAPMRAYMREQFDFLGLPTPLRRAVSRPWLRELDAADAETCLALAQALWREPQREFHYLALDLLARHVAQLPPQSLPALLALATDQSWWDSVDPLAGTLVGGLVHRHRSLQPAMDRLSGDDNPWLRRVALLHQLNWKQDTDRERLFAYCRANAADGDFFIRKAIGWALRQYARIDGDAVRDFVERNALSALSRREALKHIGR